MTTDRLLPLFAWVFAPGEPAIAEHSKRGIMRAPCATPIPMEEER